MTTNPSDSCSAEQKDDVTSDVTTKTKSVSKYQMMTPKKTTNGREYNRFESAENVTKTRVANCQKKCREICQSARKAVESSCSNLAKHIITPECRETGRVNEEQQNISWDGLKENKLVGCILASKEQKKSTKNAVGKKMTDAENIMKASVNCQEILANKLPSNCREISQPAGEGVVDSAGSSVAEHMLTSECQETGRVTEDDLQDLTNQVNSVVIAGAILASKLQKKNSTKNPVRKSTTRSIANKAAEFSNSSSVDQYSCSGYTKENTSVKKAENDESLVVSLGKEMVGGSVGSAHGGARRKEVKEPKLTEQCADTFGYYHYDQYSTEGVKGKKGPLYRGPPSSKMTKRKYLSTDPDTPTGLSKSCANKVSSQKALQSVKSVQKSVEKEDSSREAKNDLLDKKEYGGNKKYGGKNASRAAKARHENQVYLASTKDAERRRRNDQLDTAD